MGKIISGGLKSLGSDETKKKPSQPIPQTLNENTTDNSEEGWQDYVLRNLSKTPALLYSSLRSGLGAGNLLDLYARKGTTSPEAQQVIQSGLKTLLPTRKQAHEEISQVLPKYFTEQRSGDEPAEFLSSELPFIAAGGGFKSAGNLGRSLLSSLGILGGSEVGSSIGGNIGESFGDREIGELVGGYAGAKGGSKASQFLSNRPSKVIGPKIEKRERDAFDYQQQEKLKEVTGAKKKFEQTKLGQIDTSKKEIASYKNKIKNIEAARKPLYEEAARLQGNSKGSAKKIRNVINEVGQELTKGISSSDASAITHNLNSIDNAIQNGNLSVKDATTIQKNLNDQIYNRGVSNSFKRQMNKVVRSLNDHIKEYGSKEHSEVWEKAEGLHRQLKELQKGEKDFIKNKQQDIRDIKQEKYHLSPQEYNDAVRTIGKETYEDVLKSKDSQNSIIDAIESIKPSASKYGLGGLGAILGYFGFGKKGALLLGTAGKLASTAAKEIRVARKAMKKHPELLREYANLIRDASKMDKNKLLNQVNNLGSQIEKEDIKQEDVSSSRGRILKGGLKFGPRTK